MQEFVFGNMKAQDAAPEPYTIYDKGKSLEEPKPENLTLRDFEYFKSMYPARMKDLQLHVEAVCDEMDYEGSCLYDEYPDRVMVEQLKKKVELRLAKEDLTGTKQTVTRNEASETAQAAQPEMAAAWPAAAQAAQPETEAAASPEATDIIQSAAMETSETLPRTSFGPQAVRADAGNNRRWEMEALLRRETESNPVLEAEERRPGSHPWGPPPPPPRPGNPWGPPPPPPRPGNPWGPPPPPPRPGNPWGPPPPPRPVTPPWGPPHWGPPPRPDHKSILGDMISLLLFGEMQRRRCRSRICR